MLSLSPLMWSSWQVLTKYLLPRCRLIGDSAMRAPSMFSFVATNRSTIIPSILEEASIRNIRSLSATIYRRPKHSSRPLAVNPQASSILVVRYSQPAFTRAIIRVVLPHLPAKGSAFLHHRTYRCQACATRTPDRLRNSAIVASGALYPRLVPKMGCPRCLSC